MEFLGILCLILITTTLAGVACKRVGIPAVIGQLLVGIVLGPTDVKYCASRCVCA